MYEPDAVLPFVPEVPDPPVNADPPPPPPPTMEYVPVIVMPKGFIALSDEVTVRMH